MAQGAHRLDDGLVWLRLPLGHRVIVDFLQVVLPGRLNVGRVAVVRQVEDLQANVAVAARVCVFVEQL